MKSKLLLLSILLFSIIGFSQHTISGNLSPKEEYSWLLLYRISPDNEVFVIDTTVTDGKFSFTLPKDSSPGMYRIVYAVPQDEFFFDVVFSGKEDIVLDYGLDTGLSFTKSIENNTLYGYLGAVLEIETRINENLDFGVKTDNSVVQSLFSSLKQLQIDFELKSKNLYCAHFIKANAPFIPANPLTVKEYHKQKQAHTLEVLDFNSKKLQSSTFLIDKSLAFAFTATPLKGMSKEEAENAIQANINTLSKKIPVAASNGFKKRIYHGLWKQMVKIPLNNTADYIYTHFLSTLPDTKENLLLKEEIKEYMTLRLGVKAPNIKWDHNGVTKTLYDIKAAKNIVLVFWSSSCPHCLEELPVFHKQLPKFPNLTVIAVALEDKENNWPKESAKLPGFTHALALNKWQSEAAKNYAIKSTPTYFILNTKMEIVAKPEDSTNVIQWLNKL